MLNDRPLSASPRARAIVSTLVLVLAMPACKSAGAGAVARVRAAVPSAREPDERSSTAPAEARPPAIPLAPPHPAIETLFAGPLASVDDRSRSNSVGLDEADCRVWTGFEGAAIERCELALLANGTAPCVSVIYDCGAHLCETETYLWFGDNSAPRRVQGGGVDTLELSPDHRYLIRSELVHSDEPNTSPLPEGARTLQEDLSTGETKTIASCLSTVLSPGNRYYVCRDLAGNVLRFPISGGPLELVAEARVPENERLKLGGSFSDYPQPVEFSGDGRMKFSLYLQSETVLEREVPWRE